MEAQMANLKAWVKNAWSEPFFGKPADPDTSSFEAALKDFKPQPPVAQPPLKLKVQVEPTSVLNEDACSSSTSDSGAPETPRDTEPSIFSKLLAAMPSPLRTDTSAASAQEAEPEPAVESAPPTKKGGSVRRAVAAVAVVAIAASLGLKAHKARKQDKRA